MRRRWFATCIAVLGSMALAACAPAVARVPAGAAGAPTSAATGTATPTRTAAETLPAATDLSLVYHPPAADGKSVDAGAFGARLRLLVLALNALPAAKQPAARCTTPTHETVDISTAEPTSLDFRGSLGPCGVLTVTVGGATQPALGVTSALRDAVRQAVAPPQPAPPVGPLEAPLRPTAHSAAAARRQADALLALTRLPEAAQETTPVTVAQNYYIADDDATIVERQTQWLSAMNPGDLTDWLMRHPPDGLRNSSSGSSNGELSQAFTTDLNGHLTLNVVAEARDSGSEVRVDAVVEWTPTKPALERVATASGTLHYVAPTTADGKAGRHVNLTLHGASLRTVVRALNALQTTPENTARGCGAPTNETWTLRFRSRGHLVVFTDDVTSCSIVRATAGTTRLPDMYDSIALDAAIDAAVHSG